MKIQFFGENCFGLTSKEVKIVLDPNNGCTLKTADFVTNSGKFETEAKKISAKKVLSLGGEFEISGVLVRGFASEPGNIVYKIVVEGITCAHFGTLTQIPTPEFFAKIGENIDVAILNLSEKFGVKEVKEIIETVEPRWTIIGGSQTLFPKMIGEGAKLMQENNLSLSTAGLSEEKTEILILSV